MRIFHCSYVDLIEKLKNNKIILFGKGDYFEANALKILSDELLKNVAYLVDNNITNNEICINGRNMAVYPPSVIEKEEKCIVIITSSHYMYEIYQQLKHMQINDGIQCCSLPLIMEDSVGKSENELKRKIFNKDIEPNIKKIIHSFWFSGETKPKSYQRCIDSWKRYCSDYKIIEWNIKNYNFEKNNFMKQAVEKKKWAFVSDYARLDVIYHMGGIYMDMDVELLKSPDGLLGNEAFFTFDVNNDIDLCIFGSKKGNPLINKLMLLYENINFNDDMKTMLYYCQPRFIRNTLEDCGIKMSGDMQILNQMAFLPRNFLNPKNRVIDELCKHSDDLIGIHHYNNGWINDDNYKQRIIKNRNLMKIFRENKIND